jgi:tight adherence protein C
MDGIIFTLGILVLAAVVCIVVYFGLTSLDEKDRFKQTMKRAQGFGPDVDRDEEIAKGLKERVVHPFMERLVPLLHSKTPVGYVDKIRKKMIQLGKPDRESIDTFLAFRLFSLLAILPIILVFFVTSIGRGLAGGLSPLVGILLIVCAVFAPDAILNRKVSERKTAIQDQLPDILDLLTISVEAGLGFEQAVDRVVSNVPGPLSEEMNRMLGESRSGMSRAESLRAMDRRVDLPDLRSFVLAILQADKFGVSIGRVLRLQSEEMRIKRRQIAQEKAQKAPVKLLIPTAFCIFPVMFIVILGPAVMRIMSGGF